MLGIRHCNGVAVDLWQGDIRKFVNDLGSELKSATVNDLKSFFVDLHATAGDIGARHAAVAVDAAICNPEAAAATISQIRTLLTEQKSKKTLRRITLVLPSLEAYACFQDALFAGIPES